MAQLSGTFETTARKLRLMGFAIPRSVNGNTVYRAVQGTSEIGDDGTTTLTYVFLPILEEIKIEIKLPGGE